MDGIGFFTCDLSSRFGFRTIHFIGSCIITIGLFLESFSYSYWHLLITQGILFGVGASFTYFPALAAPTQWFKSKRGLALGIATSGSGIGALVMSLITEVVIQKYGFLLACRFIAIGCFAVNMVSNLFLTTRSKNSICSEGK